MIAGLILLSLVAIGIISGLFATASAPVGFQDEQGFHFGSENEATQSTYSYPHAEPQVSLSFATKHFFRRPVSNAGHPQF